MFSRSAFHTIMDRANVWLSYSAANIDSLPFKMSTKGLLVATAIEYLARVGLIMRILGIDPGTATTGYGIVEQQAGRAALVDYGTIITVANLDMPQRLTKINQELNRLLDEFRPDVVAVEEIFFHKNAKTIVTVAQARGVVLMTIAAAGVQVAEYTPLQVKQAVVGYGQADKRQVQLMVQKLLSMKDLPRPDDAADALAVAICHLHSYKIQELYQLEKARTGDKG